MPGDLRGVAALGYGHGALGAVEEAKEALEGLGGSEVYLVEEDPGTVADCGYEDSLSEGEGET